MDQDTKYSVKCESFKGRRDEEVAWLCFSENLMLHATDLEARDKVLEYLELISKDDKIRVVIILGSPDKSGREEYYNFYQLAKSSKLSMDAVQRMTNVLNQFILSLVKLNKFVVHANSGKVITPFMNIGLACDYRIIADNTVYQNPNIELGLVPKGGGAYFLPKMIGIAKALDVMLAENDITAKEALELGIVNRVVSNVNLEETALQTARRFAKYPTSSLTGVKKLLSFSLKDLSDLMELENQLLMKTVRSQRFWERIEE